jgi:hypothetical protein
MYRSKIQEARLASSLRSLRDTLTRDLTFKVDSKKGLYYVPIYFLFLLPLNKSMKTPKELYY